ncbi:MAG: ankyrin repeat domain-containing protein [Candidatus Thiodiazotropha sp. (ex Troendleina suluensis)]|nr:ankyrin repeat domain-containing protein [Candidatus Thiodiazotropha sp. (ex Troendleina suluensis)]
MAMPKLKALPLKGRDVPPDVPNIFSAAENNDVKALDLALEFYDVNQQDVIGMTPLHYAASTLSNQTIDRLLAHPDIDATLCDEFGRSAATVAYECWNMLADQVIDKLNPHCYPWLHPSPEQIP